MQFHAHTAHTIIIIVLLTQILMSVKEGHTNVVKSVLTLLALISVLVILGIS